jgi:hypothetical protein
VKIREKNSLQRQVEVETREKESLQHQKKIEIRESEAIRFQEASKIEALQLKEELIRIKNEYENLQAQLVNSKKQKNIIKFDSKMNIETNSNVLNNIKEIINAYKKEKKTIKT